MNRFAVVMFIFFGCTSLASETTKKKKEECQDLKEIPVPETLDFDCNYESSLVDLNGYEETNENVTISCSVENKKYEGELKIPARGTRLFDMLDAQKMKDIKGFSKLTSIMERAAYVYRDFPAKGKKGNVFCSDTSKFYVCGWRKYFKAFSKK